MKMSKYIDHTLLKPDASEAAVTALCRDAVRYDFASVCVNPCNLPTVVKELAGSTVKPCVVIGFPLGAMTTKAKVFEAADAVENGAMEVDMVLNIGRLKDGDDSYVTGEIRAVKEAVGDRVLKVILETCLLSREEIIRACHDATDAGADFVKTSTGFSGGGASAEAVKLMKETVGPDMGVKASGGIRTKEDFEIMIEAGADRIGTSNGTAIIANE